MLDATRGEEHSVINPQPMGPRSATAVARLTRVPRFLLIIAVVAVFVGGLLLPGLVGALLLAVVAALTGWLAWLGWAGQPPATRALRLLVTMALAVGAVSKLL
jgi:hypothetical protein